MPTLKRTQMYFPEDMLRELKRKADEGHLKPRGTLHVFPAPPPPQNPPVCRRRSAKVQ